MRSSYIVPIHKGIVTLPRDLQEQMNIGKDCLLYAKVADKSGVVSSIPPTSWTRAYRLIIHTAERPGTLAQVAGTLSEVGINFLASWSAAISPLGEGCLTSIVELPENLAGRATQEVQLLIEEKLREKKVLSGSSLFQGEGRLDPVHLTPLGFLSAAVSRSKQEVYELNVKDWALDLRYRAVGSRFSLYDALRREARSGRPQLPTRALITPDTEERYFRISFLPSDTNLYFVEFTLNVESTLGNFGGFFQTALEVLADHELNIYGARNLLLEKSMKNGSASQEEKAKFSFVIDINSGIDAIEPAGFRRVLQRDFRIALESHAEENQASVKIQGDSFIYSLYESSWPRCFLATNAKKNPLYLEFACKLHRELVALGLNPVNVDITMSESGVVVEDVTLLLRSCPLLISLHLPDERNELELDDDEESSDSRARKVRYAPSDWVLFEESFMRGLGRKIFRMRHETVREPAFSPGSREYVFKDATFSRELRNIADAVRRHMTTTSWQKNLEASAAAARSLDPALLQRNLEGEYCVRRRAMAQAERGEVKHE